MISKKLAVFNWSGGKDSALALQIIMETNEYEVISLFTVMDKLTGKSSIHSIPKEVLSVQAESIGIPLYCQNFDHNLADYEKQMLEVVRYFKNLGVTHFIFGDIALADVKHYREGKLNPLGIEVVAPLWEKTSERVMADFLNSEIRAKIIVTQADKLDCSFIGKELNRKTIESFPDDIDICGENGEYHSIAFDGKLFKNAVNFSFGITKKVSYDIKLDDDQIKTFEYWQADVIP
jgi:uncharacterized protein (TIGR00290 family)